ncbi:MAG TPA: dihydrofolate reductase, partial [bacterium]|nr:dihydrofolate reductase [bacterium]
MSSVKTTEAFTRVAERFADMQVLRYRIDGFDGLTLSQKTFLYYLQEAALSGRDMVYDQYYKHNLLVRKTIEQIVAHYAGDRHSKDFEKFMTYAKKMWASNGIHNHYTSDKFKPDFSKEYFLSLVEQSSHAEFPWPSGRKGDQTKDLLVSILF